MARFAAVFVALFAVPAASSVVAWWPDCETIRRDLTYKSTPQEDEEFAALDEFKGMKFTRKPQNWRTHWFDAVFWPVWTARNWQIPLAAVAVYFVSIPMLKWLVVKYGKWNVRSTAFYWNAALSLFSWCGAFSCIPTLASTVFEHGLFFTCCAPATWYGGGLSGFFVALFVYSKIAELVDTILLLLAGRPVIALQWWHHSTVLLYCWHSYSTRIATGLWFAAMNYSVHSVMYGYFALMSTRFRRYITPYAIFITLAQLLQMLVGMFVTIKAVMYQAAGHECSVNKTNSVLGLTMYFSYFVLFFKLFIENYVTQTRKRALVEELPVKRNTLAEITKDVSRKVTSQILPQMDDEEESSDDVKVSEKKLN